MRCVVHIGTEKTATTTIQRFFDRERAQLAANGFAYTRTPGIGNNWKLAVAAYDDDRRDDLSAAAGVDDLRSRPPFRSTVVSGVAAELADFRTEHEVGVIVFSSEHLQSRLSRRSEIERLAAILTDLGATETEIIIYLRDPVALAASLHSTVVKHGGTKTHPPPPGPGSYYHLVCDHRSSIERWSHVFDTVTPRLFEPDALVGGSVVTDVCHAIGIPPEAVGRSLESGSGSDEHLNRSLTTAEVEVLSRINEVLPREVEGRPNPKRSELVSAMERRSSGPSYRLPPRRAELYRDAFAESNEWVRRRYFPSRDHLFASEHPDYDPGPHPPGYDGLADLIAELWSKSPLTPTEL